MDKRQGLRQHYQKQETQAQELKMYQQRTKQLQNMETTVVEAFRALIQFIDGKTTKTEVVNQLKSISTPDVDKVVQAVSKLDKDILANKLDLKPVTDGLNGLKRELSLIPKTLPKIPEAKDKIEVTNLDEIKLDTSAVEKAIKGLKLDVKAPIINTEKTDITPLREVMLDLLKAINSQKPVEIPKFPEIPKTDLKGVEKKLDESNKHLKKLIEKPVGGGGGGGNSTSYKNSSGNLDYVELEADGSIPVTVVTGGSSSGRWASYQDARQDLSSDPMYFGKEDASGNWVIKRFGITSQTTMYYEGTGGISSNWAGRAGYTYVEFNAL